MTQRAPAQSPTQAMSHQPAREEEEACDTEAGFQLLCSSS